MRKNKQSWAERRLHPLFRRWTHIRQSCLNPRYADYKEGLDCDGLDDFDEFKNWIENSIGLPPTPQSKLNRIDQTLGWIRGNLRWTDSKGVGHNIQGHNVWLELYGERLCLQDLSDRYGIKYATVRSRYLRGWSTEQIVTIPVSQSNRIIKKRRKNLENRTTQNS